MPIFSVVHRLWAASVLMALAAGCLQAPVALQAASTTYYLSPTGEDANPGTEAQPWRTLGRLQTALTAGQVMPGDAVRFARGGVFPGRLTLGASTQGTVTAPIVFGAYGAGAPPILSGMHALTGWQALGQNRWRAVCAPCAALPATLAINGRPFALARWPNLDEGQGGYRTYASFSGRTSITDPALAAGPNWAGGELVLRTIAWILDRLPIAAHTGGTLVTAAPASYDITPGWGYFIQNHLAALDQPGEWVYTAADQSITLLWPTDPTGLLIEVPVEARVLDIVDSAHLVWQDLEVRGAMGDLVHARDCAGLRLTRVTLRLAGDHALRLTNCPGSQVVESTAVDSLNVGLRLLQCGDCVVTGAVIERIGLQAGMGRNGDGQYVGVEMGGTPGHPAILEASVVNGIGYAAVTHYGPAITRRNLIRDYNRVKTDGAGLYTYRITDVALLDNLVLEAEGSTAGTPWTSTGTHGIYIDDNSERITVSGNTVARVSGAGVYLHNTRSVTVTDNLIYAVAEAGLLMVDDDLGTYGVEASLIRGNAFLLSGAPMVRAESSQTTALFTTLGVLDEHRYCDPFGPPWFVVALPGTGAAAKPLAQWQADHGRDLAATVCPQRYATHLVTGAPDPNRVSNGTFDSGLAGWFGWPDDTLEAVWESGRLDGGSVRVGFNGPAPALHYDHPVGAVQAGEVYRLRLSAIGITSPVAVTAYLRQGGAPYARVSNAHHLLAGASRGEHEAFFTVTADQADTLLILELNTPGTVIGLDNVVVQRVTADPQTLSDVTRLYINPGAASRAYQLDGFNYTGLDGAPYPAFGTVTVPPNRGLVVLQGAAVQPEGVFLPGLWR